MKKILVLGVSGMLGHKVFEVLLRYGTFDVYGTVTSLSSFDGLLPNCFKTRIIEGVYADKIGTLESVIRERKPDVVINCIGIIKQNKNSKDCVSSLLINALFPHLAADVCEKNNARFITVATDCVFDGSKGDYHDDDLPTCHDIYGMTKFLGEVKDKTNSLTLRTSIIGHELNSNISLLDWFLSQENEVKGFTEAIFSGFTTLEFAKLLAEKIIPNDSLSGLYQISVNPISKYDLLKLVADVYSKDIKINTSDELKINRSLNSDALRGKIDYNPPTWEYLIKEMYNDFLRSDFYKIKRKEYEENNKI